MKNLSIPKKLILAFAIIILLLIGTVLVAMQNLTSISEDFTTFHDHSFVTNMQTITISSLLNAVEKNMINASIAANAAEAEAYLADVDDSIAEITSARGILSEVLIGNEDLLAQFNEEASVAAEVRGKVAELVRANQGQAALTLYQQEYAPRAQSLRKTIGQISVNDTERAETFYMDAKASQKSATILSIGLGGLTLVIAALLSMYIIRSITKPLREIEQATKRLSNGELDVTVTYQSKDELGSLAESTRTLISNLRAYIGNISDVLGHMADGDLSVEVTMDYQKDFAPIKSSLETILSSFNAMFLKIQQSAEQVATGSSQVASGAQALSQGATEQASSIEELSATINEISEQIKENAANAQNANRTVAETTREIENGQAQMTQLVAAMNDISQTSNEINKIIKTIDDIAFQTNILALNAAVEAARAGVAGKGFAVVAEEVRNLAAKSAEAAKNTTTLIEDAIRAISNGTNMVTATEQSLQAIVEKAENVSRLVNEIAQASNEQATAVAQTTIGIDQISSVVQNNSATAEESAAASEELSGQALMLNNLIAKVRLKGDDAPQQPRSQAQLNAPEEIPSTHYTYAPSPVAMPSSAYGIALEKY